MKVYVIFHADEYELPVHIADSLKNCAQWLNVPSETIRTALKRHNVYKGKKYNVEAVQINK